jgi:hydroxypyruvate reductase
VRVLAVGKAAHAMASAAAQTLGSRITHGLVIGLPGAGGPPDFECLAGTHPVPGPESERAGRRALALAASVPPGESVLLLLSGGGSAIMAVPADGITLEDKRSTTDRLLKGGADIYALNTVRKHISGVKGGQLAAAAGAPFSTLAISDVVGDDLSVIASGPGVPDPSTFDDAIGVLRRFGGESRFPPAVVARLARGVRGEIAETPKPGDPRLARAVARVIGGRTDAMEGASREARSRGYHVLQIDDAVVGEARSSSQRHFDMALARASGADRPFCLVSSGETTVHVVGRGTGGRNQEFVLAAVERLAASNGPVVIASAGTDGIDGPTDAAGAVADSSTRDRAIAAGAGSSTRFLAENDAYAFFAPLGDLIRTGPTDTNVGDLQVVLFG